MATPAFRFLFALGRADQPARQRVDGFSGRILQPDPRRGKCLLHGMIRVSRQFGKCREVCIIHGPFCTQQFLKLGQNLFRDRPDLNRHNNSHRLGLCIHWVARRVCVCCCSLCCNLCCSLCCILCISVAGSANLVCAIRAFLIGGIRHSCLRVSRILRWRIRAFFDARFVHRTMCVLAIVRWRIRTSYDGGFRHRGGFGGFTSGRERGQCREYTHRPLLIGGRHVVLARKRLVHDGK